MSGASRASHTGPAAASGFVAIVDKNGMLRFVTPPVEGVLGHRPEDLVGRPVVDWVHPDDAAAAGALLAAPLEGTGTAGTLECRVRRAGGGWAHVEITGVDLRDDPSVAGVIVIARDRRGREAEALALGGRRLFTGEETRLAHLFAVQAALALENARLYEESEERLRIIVETRRRAEQREAMQVAVTRILGDAPGLADAVPRLLTAIGEGGGWVLAEAWTLDPDGRRLRHESSWSAAGDCCAAFAAGSRAVTFAEGEGLAGTVWATRQPRWVPDVREAAGFRRREEAEAAGLGAALGVPVVVGADVAAVLAFFAGETRPPDQELIDAFVDIASQIAQLIARERAERALRQSEEQFRQAQKMEAIGRLAGGVAHDFNNLLTVIDGRSQLVLARLPADAAPRRDLEIVRDATRRASALTRQLLAFSRKQVLQPKVLDLNEVVAGMSAMLQRLIGEHIELQTLSAPGLWPVKADPSQLEQVVMNLVINARDAMPAGGRLTVRTANVQLDATRAREYPGSMAGPHVLLAVSDTGHGMDAETRAKAFEPFFTTKAAGKGTGLGLSTVYGIVTQSGGHIALSSEPGRGSVFTIYLPRAVEVAASTAAGAVAGAALRGTETVLLVEDEASVRELACEVLQAQGYAVITATTGPDALRLLRTDNRRVDLMVTDVVMPQMSGKDLADRVTALRPGIPVLFMSGYTDEAIADHGVLDPGTVLLEKPFTPEALGRKVRELLDSR